MKRLVLAALLMVPGRVPGQELLWEVWPTPDQYVGLAHSFGDFDGDAAADLLTDCLLNYGQINQMVTVRILSGLDGSVLHTAIPFGRPMDLEGVGDFDLDGHPDYAISWWDGLNPIAVQVWSPHTGQLLLQVTGPARDGFGRFIAGDLELDGDGLPDLVTANSSFSVSEIQAHSHFGALLYRIDMTALARVVLDVRALDDLTGDGRNEFLVGGVDGALGYSRGYVSVIDGSNGTILRTSYDQIQGDIIGYPIATAGDMDRDGVQDYATSNYWGGSGSGREVLTVYSGATGAVIREWSVPNYDLATRIVGGHDIDLDGTVDILAGSMGFPHPTLGYGRVQAFSSRDGQLLLHTEPQSYSTLGDYAWAMADLGVQPGNPYPVFAMTYGTPSPGNSPFRLQAWRCSPPGATVTGLGCSSSGDAPSVGVRRLETAAAEHCRIVLGSAPPGAVAWCFAAAARSDTVGGHLLPLALDPLGFGGCTLYVPPTLSDTRLVGSGPDDGYAAIDLPLQLTDNGFRAAVQWLVLDFASGAFAATPRCEFAVR